MMRKKKIKISTLIKERDELQAWKAEEMRVWLPVIQHFQENKSGKLKIGDDIAEHIIGLDHQNDELLKTLKALVKFVTHNVEHIPLELINAKILIKKIER